MTIGQNSEYSAFDTSIMSRTPYYDDYDPQNKYLKVLFKPGVPLQARELSYAQSILQNQIQRFGSHIFEQGSLVLGGDTAIASAGFLRLQNNLPSTELSSLVRQTIENSNSVLATIVGVADVPAAAESLTNDNQQVVFVQYNTAGEFSETDILSTTGEGSVGLTFEVSSGSTAPNKGTATNFIAIDTGVFFLDGHFALNDAQQFAAYSKTGGYRDFANPTASVGFEITKSIVNATEDPTLNDPAFGFNNFNAPGADRFKINPTLAQRELSGGSGDASGFEITGGTNDYVELVRVVNGTTTKRVKFADYAELEKTLARRTFDESGNYTVNPFSLVIDEYESTFASPDTSKVSAVLSPGKAYVQGYNYETIAPTNFAISKPRTTRTINRERIETQEGPFFEIGKTADINLQGFAAGSEQIIRNGKRLVMYDENGVVSGTVYIRNLRPADNYPSGVKVFFQDAVMFGGKDISQIRRVSDTLTNISGIGDAVDSQDAFGFTLEPNGESIKNVGNSKSLIFKVPKGGPVQSMEGNLYESKFTVTKTFFGIADEDGEVTFTSEGENEFFESNIFLSVVGETAENVSGSGAGAGATMIVPNLSATDNPNNEDNTITFNGLPASSKVTAVIPMKYKSNSNDDNIRTKTLVTETQTNLRTNFIASLNQDIVFVNAVDIYELLTVEQNGVDIKDKFVFDNGQRNEYYDWSRLVLKQGESLATDNNITVSYRRFQHSANDGGPFTAQSYVNSGITPGPEFAPTLLDPNTGEKLILTDCLDFRPVRRRNTDGSAEFFDYNVGGILGGGSVTGGPPTYPFVDLVEVPFVSYSTYLPRVDSVILGADRVIRIVSGTPSLNAQPPSLSDDDMELYRIFLPAYTVDADKVNVRYLDLQRFTMTDIGDLQDATFSDSEFNYRLALRSQALAAALGLFPGAEGIEDGIFIDDLIGHGNADATKRQHNVSIDPVNNTLRSAFETRAYGVTFATNAAGGGFSSNIRKHSTKYGEIYTAANLGSDGSTANYINNLSVGSTLAVNPFGVVDNLGKMQLDPFCDKYWSETKAAKVIVNVAGENNVWQKGISAPFKGKRLGFGTQWKDWETIWFGRSVGNEAAVSQNDPDNIKYTQSLKSAFVKRVLSEKITRRIGDKIVDLSIVPYMRAVTINGSVQGVKPSTTHYLYFDNQLVGSTTDGYDSDEHGEFEFTVSIPTDTYLTGEKLVRVMDNNQNSISLATSSADSTFYASGKLDTNANSVRSFRPAILRRDAANVDTIGETTLGEILGGGSFVSLNSLDPLAQVFTVDENSFPDGMFIRRVGVLFREKPLEEDAERNSAIHGEIRPVNADGTPSKNVVVPLSEVSRISSKRFFNNGTQDASDQLTYFTFDVPVYLAPGTYAFCLKTNNTKYTLWVTDQKQPNMGGLFLPRNDGRTVFSPESYLSMKIERHLFREGQSEVRFFPEGGITTDLSFNAYYMNTAPQLYNTGSPILTRVIPHSDLSNGDNRRPTNLTVELDDTKSGVEQLGYVWESTLDVSQVVDKAQCQFLAIKNYVGEITSDEITLQKLSTDELGSATARYYSKVVTVGTAAANLNVRLAGKFPPGTKALVFGKFRSTNSSESSIETEPYIELTPDAFVTSSADQDGNLETVINNFSADFDLLNDDVSATGLFNEYKLKIILSNSTNDKIEPIIESIASVPLARKTGGQFFQTLAPTGEVVAYAGDNAPTGWLLCDGKEYLKSEFTRLSEVLGATYKLDGDDTTTKFRVPDLRSRVPVGVRSSTDASSDDGLVERTRGATGGSHKLQGHTHLNPAEPNGTIGGGSVSDAGELNVWNPGSVGYRTGQSSYFNGVEADNPAGKSKFKDILIDDGVDVSGTELDGELTESMPPFQVLNYIIKI